MKIQKKNLGGGGGGWVGLGVGQGGCENSKKEKLGGGGVRGRGRGEGRGQVGGVRVDVIEELKFLGKFTKKKWGGGGIGLVGFRLGGGGGQGGCE